MKQQVKPNDVASKLRAAKALIADEAHWCRGALGFLPDGTECHTMQECRDANRVCSYGALGKLLGYSWSPLGRYLARAVEPETVAAFNDSHTHAEVLAAFDRAIELAESEVPAARCTGRAVR